MVPLKKGSWEPQEDEVIKSLVAEGIRRWSVIATHVPGRTGKQCRERCVVCNLFAVDIRAGGGGGWVGGIGMEGCEVALCPLIVSECTALVWCSPPPGPVQVPQPP